MKRILSLLVLLIGIAGSAVAQSRVFKGVSETMALQIKTIYQNGSIVGYVAFEQQEKINADSFSYKLTILDENLNDIGNYSFKDLDLELQQAVFEQDVLCLAYIRSNITRHTPVNFGSGQKMRETAACSIYSQFLSLEGTLINSSEIRADCLLNFMPYTISHGKLGSFMPMLKNKLNVINIPGRGFAFVYGDGDTEYPRERKNEYFRMPDHKIYSGSEEHIVVYDLKGSQLWHRLLPEAKSEGLLVAAQDEQIFILRKRIGDVPDGDRELLSYRFGDSTYSKQKDLKDKNGNPLYILGFKRSASGKQVLLSGAIINKAYQSKEAIDIMGLYTKFIRKGFYLGVFDIRLAAGDPVEQYQYWSDGSRKDIIEEDGYIPQLRSYGLYNFVFDDFSGNTYYVCTPVDGLKTYSGKVLLLQMQPDGQLSFYNILSTNVQSLKQFFLVTNEEKQAQYLVAEDPDKSDVYDVLNAKLVRSISRHPEKNIYREVLKGKSGHIIVMEYNRKERTTKVSIEAL